MPRPNRRRSSDLLESRARCEHLPAKPGVQLFVHLVEESLGPPPAGRGAGARRLESSAVWSLSEHVAAVHESLEGGSGAWDKCSELHSFFALVRSLREACDAVLDLEAAVESQQRGCDDETSNTGAFSDDESLSVEADADLVEPGGSRSLSAQASLGPSETDEDINAIMPTCHAMRGMVPTLDLACISDASSPVSTVKYQIAKPVSATTPSETPGASATRELSFSTSCSYTRLGQHIRVVGSCDALGAWDPYSGLPLKTTADTFPLWKSTGTVLLDAGIPMEYKYVICDQGGAAVQWEKRRNRHLHLAPADTAAGCSGDHLVIAQAFDACDEEGPQLYRPAPLGLVAALCTPRQPLLEVPLLTPTTRRHLQPVRGNGFLGVPGAATPLAREDSWSQLFEPRGRDGFASGEAFRRRFELMGSGPLAEGGFGLVWRCRPRSAGPVGGAADPTEFAAKIINKEEVMNHNQSGNIRIQDEVQLHSDLKHPHIVNLLEYFDEGGTLTLLLEFCAGGDLFDAIMREAGRRPSGGLEEQAAATAARHVLQALAYMHGRAVVHRDVKCENVLLARAGVPLARNVFKLGDFGFAAREGGSGLCGQVGSPDTVAPEVVAGKIYGCPADLWSAGVVLYMTLSAEPPFPAQTDKQVLQRVLRGDYGLQGGPWTAISPPAARLVESLMTVCPALRPSAGQALQSRWLQSGPPSEAPPSSALCRLERSGGPRATANSLDPRFSVTDG